MYSENPQLRRVERVFRKHPLEQYRKENKTHLEYLHDCVYKPPTSKMLMFQIAEQVQNLAKDLINLFNYVSPD